MGAGLSISLKSVATYYVDKSQLGTLYTGLASAEMLGAMLGGPSLALLLAAGINSHGQWAIALPFWVSTVSLSSSTIVTRKVSNMRCSIDYICNRDGLDLEFAGKEEDW